MVKILANGEIVSDEYQENQAPHKHHKSTIGRIVPSNDTNDLAQQRQGFLPTANIIQYINQCLTAYGAPTFSLGGFIFRPIVTLGVLLATLIWGLKGTIFSVLLYFVVHFSQTAGSNIPFIQNMLQNIGLAERQPNQSSSNRSPHISYSQASTSFDSTGQSSVDKPTKSVKPFPGTGHKLVD